MARQAPLGPYIPTLVLALAILNLSVTGLSLLVDSITLWDLRTQTIDDESATWSARAISGMILVAFHMSLSMIQIYYGTKLFAAVRERDHVKCRNWFFIAINIYCAEFMIFLLIAMLAMNVAPFIAFAALSMIYKMVQLWPVDGFIQNLQSYSEPLLGEAAEFHI